MISRREFLKRAGVIGASTAIDGSVLKPLQPLKKNINQSNQLDHEYPFPYDSSYFEAAERVVFINPEHASINIIPKDGKSLDIKLYIEQEDRIRIMQDKVFSYYGVNDSFDIPFYNLYRDP
ncbi:MAG: twin-arginine translocation signal domain-containing protein, partial [Candidatus Aminicenantes bacterium]|nr:twin-arginine translocation signal domain-containing protein [Candidatus Aminicenantes bacterium]